jgi:RimJ/RimL family protein N-acetyltransferase
VEVRLYDEVAAFTEVALSMLHRDPVRHTIAVTVLGELSTPHGPYHEPTLLTAHDNDSLRGVALRVGQWPLITSALPPNTAPAVAEALHTVANPPPGVSGPKDNAEAFATAWRRQTGETARVARNQRLFQLAELRSPAGVPGVPRLADSRDIPLLARWHHEFAMATSEGWRHSEDSTAHVTRRLATGQAQVFWEVRGQPVAMAAASKPIAAMSRIGPVWTPPQLRGHGYGSAVTAAASRWAMAAGASHVVLFTDLANPISNSIYPKIGYRPVYDAVELTFIPAGSSTDV